MNVYGQPNQLFIPAQSPHEGMRQRDGDLDLASNFAEVVEATPREVEELAPLIGLGVGGPARLVHELEYEGAARADV